MYVKGCSIVTKAGVDSACPLFYDSANLGNEFCFSNRFKSLSLETVALRKRGEREGGVESSHLGVDDRLEPEEVRAGAGRDEGPMERRTAGRDHLPIEAGPQGEGRRYSSQLINMNGNFSTLHATVRGCFTNLDH